MPGRPRILFVDDEPKVLSGLKRALRSRADVWDMDFIARPEVALASYRSSPPDVVVSDLAMPGMNGLDMIFAMRSAGGESEFILLTGTGTFATAIEAVNRAGIHRFFTKPCPTDLLAEGITSALAERSAAAPGGADRAGLAALNRLAMGVVVVDEAARIMFANTAGTRILAEKDGLLASSSDICRASTASETAALHGLARRACADSMSEDEASGIALTRPSLKRSLIALVAPEQTDAGPRRAIIFVFDPERQALPQTETISRLFALSPMEGKLVRALAEGKKLEAVAQELEITVSTARTYLKQAFSKTGTGRQSELLKLVLTASGIET